MLRTSNSALASSEANMTYLSKVLARTLPHSTRLLKEPWNYSRASCHFFSAMYIFPPHSIITPTTLGSSMVEAKFWLSLKMAFIRLVSFSSMHIWISNANTSNSMLPFDTSKNSVREKSQALAAAYAVRHAVFRSTSICSRGANC